MGISRNLLYVAEIARDLNGVIEVVITNVELTPRMEADDMRGYTGVERERLETFPLSNRLLSTSHRFRRPADVSIQVQLSAEGLPGVFGDSKAKRSASF